MLKILQARLQQYMDREFPMFKFVLEKAEEPKVQTSWIKSRKMHEDLREKF